MYTPVAPDAIPSTGTSSTDVGPVDDGRRRLEAAPADQESGGGA